uniref:Mast cell immunoglobulin like receptor 1 n=1 Tax=Cricetulus griseus TaxID=10029 RepID=A0A8C2MU10_CRIGR
MGDGGSLISFKGIRRWLDKLLLGAVFLSTAFQNTAVDCKKGKTNELPPPNLNSSVNAVRTGQNVSLSCSSKNTSMDITYSLFLGTKHLQTKKTRAGAVTFYLKISSANETGPYKCKTNVSTWQKYSQELNFTVSGKSQREESQDSGDAHMQGELYANIYETQTARQPQELHYATPVFKEVAPREQEGCVGKNPDYIYSELTR